MQRPHISTALAFMVGVCLGALLWGLSPRLTGKAEPWDSESLYYPVGLLGGGFLAACFAPRRYWVAPLGIYVGQILYVVAMLPLGSLAPLGLIVGAIFCIPALVGAFLCFAIYWLLIGKRA